MRKKLVQLSILVYCIWCLGFTIPGFLYPQEQGYISSDPTAKRTGLIFENPEQDPYAIPGIQSMSIRSLDPRMRIAASHFNTSYLPPVNSQGQQGSCVAWAVGYYLKSYQENKENNRTSLAERSNPDNICSPAFIYNLIHVKNDGGSYYSDAFRMINDFGCPSLTDMPYNDDDYQTWPDRNDFINAIPRRTQVASGEYYYLYLNSDTALNQVKQMLQNGQLLVFGIAVYYNYDHISSYNNIYTIADLSGSNRGGHAQTIVGFDDDLVTNDGVGAFRVVNSWGTGWGDSGFYWISYEAIKAGSGISSGYAYWVEDRSSYSSSKMVEFKLDHNHSRETSNWIAVGGQNKSFFDFTVNSLDREYHGFPNSNIVLDVEDLEAYLTVGADLRLYMEDNISNGFPGEIEEFIYKDETSGIEMSSSDPPVSIPDLSQDYASIVIPSPTAPLIVLSKSQLTFGSLVGGGPLPDQDFTISNGGIDPLDWSITDNRTWLDCSPTSGTESGQIFVSVDPTGLAAEDYTGTITVSSATAPNSPQYVTVNLHVYAPGTDSPPIGVMDTPAAGANVSGNIPVTGWALDDIEVERVQIKRNSFPSDPPGVIGSDGLVYLGKAFFVRGARPDVEAAYPHYPNNNRAGWGCMVLTNFLPNGGNGDYTLYAFAIDVSGHKVQIGQKLIHSDNANRINPFGTIDSPQLGNVISGTDYVNFAWALTPTPKMIPIDGSTLWVYVDGVPLGNPVYNQYREDIATRFPGYLNSGGAVGYYYLDTTQFANGLHILAWSITDDQGAVDGISRYFEIQNTGTMATSLTLQGRSTYLLDEGKRLSITARLTENKLQPAEEESMAIEVEQLQRLVLKLDATPGSRFIGWGRDESEPLPIGSTLNNDTGEFFWMLGPGFLGEHVLHFAATDGVYRGQPIQIRIRVMPKKHTLKREKE